MTIVESVSTAFYAMYAFYGRTWHRKHRRPYNDVGADNYVGGDLVPYSMVNRPPRPQAIRLPLPSSYARESEEIDYRRCWPPLRPRC